MDFKKGWQSKVDEEGRLVLPPEVVSGYGLKPGVEVLFNERTNDLRLRRPITHLSKVYIEPTNRCNLECRTCLRNVWSESLGEMSNATVEGATFLRRMKRIVLAAPSPLVAGACGRKASFGAHE